MYHENSHKEHTEFSRETFSSSRISTIETFIKPVNIFHTSKFGLFSINLITSPCTIFLFFLGAFILRLATEACPNARSYRAVLIVRPNIYVFLFLRQTRTKYEHIPFFNASKLHSFLFSIL